METDGDKHMKAAMEIVRKRAKSSSSSSGSKAKRPKREDRRDYEKRDYRRDRGCGHGCSGCHSNVTHSSQQP